jgi:predicted ATPase
MIEQLARRSVGVRPFPSPLLGREEELELLLRRWEEVKHGEGRVVLITGEPGIGKSRIARALRERLTSDPHTSLSYFCSPHHQSSALYPHTLQLTRAAGIERDDNAEVRLGKIKSLLAQSSGDFDQDMPLVAALLSIPGGDRYRLPEMTPQRRKERTLAVLLDQLKRLAARQPILVVYEDLHWIDPTSLELLSLAIEQVRDQRILLMATTRPEFSAPWPGHRHVSTLSLNRFGRSESEALIAGITKGKVLPPQVRDQIITRTDGVPLFVEELTKTVLESGLLRDLGDHYELTGPLPTLAIPSTLHASLLARLDRLAAVKDVAQIGAVIGREFSYPLIAAVAMLSERDLNAALAQLVAAELIFQRGVPPDATYQFKHALVQDASYASLVRSRRQQLHRAIAEVLEQRFPDVVATEPETLAHHFAEAGVAQEAIDYCLKAGETANARSAYQESLRHLTRALELLKSLPETSARHQQELKLLLAQGSPLIAVHGYSSPEVGKLYERASVLCKQLGETNRMFTSLHGLYLYCSIIGKTRQALRLAQECLALARGAGDQSMLVTSHRAVGSPLMQLGEFATASEAFGQVLELYESRRDYNLATQYAQDPRATAAASLALILWIVGQPEKAKRMQFSALEHAAAREHALTTAHVLYFGGAQLDLLRGEVPAVESYARSLLTLSDHHDMQHYRWAGLVLQGWVKSKRGHLRDAIGLAREGVAMLEHTKNSFRLPFSLGLLAEMHWQMGDMRSASITIADAQECARQTEQHHWKSELLRLDGEIRLAAGASEEDVAACLFQALELARNQGAKSLELRAAMSLARLCSRSGKVREARDALAPVYRSFTEGFDTLDLKEARALLERLRG